MKIQLEYLVFAVVGLKDMALTDLYKNSYTNGEYNNKISGNMPM
jgi:hypothetical protein